MSIEEPSTKKLKLSSSGNSAQLSKSATVPDLHENDGEENLFYFLGCNEGEENELHVLRTQKEIIIKKYNELKAKFNACKKENSRLKREVKISSVQLIAITSSWNSLNDFMNQELQKSSNSSNIKEHNKNIALSLLGLTKDSELARVMSEFDDREDPDEICDQVSKDKREEDYTGENSHIKDKVEKDMELFSTTFKSELEKQTQKTKVLLSTLLSKIPTAATSEESKKLDLEIANLKGKIGELESALCESLRSNMKSRKEVKRLNRSIQNLTSEKAKFTTAKEKLEAEICALKSSQKELSATQTSSSLSASASVSTGSFAAISASPDINSLEVASSSSSALADPRVAKVKDSLAVSGSPLLTGSGNGCDTNHDLMVSSGSGALFQSPGMSPAGLAPAALAQQLKSMKDAHEADERKIKELSDKCEKYSQDIVRLETRIKNPDEDTIRKHPHTVALSDRLTSLNEVNQSLDEMIKRGTVQSNMMLKHIKELNQEKIRLEQTLKEMRYNLMTAEKRATKLEDDLKMQKELEMAAQISAPADPALKKEEEFLAKKTKEIEGSLTGLNESLKAKIETFSKEFSTIASPTSTASEVEASLRKTIEELKDQEIQLLEEVENIGSAYEEIQTQNSNLTKQISEKESAKIIVLREKNKLQTTLDRLKKELDSHRAEFTSLSDEVKALKEQISLKENILQDYQMKLTISQEELNDERSKIKVAETSAKFQEDKAKIAEKEAGSYREKMRSYEKEIEELSVKLDAKKRELKRTEDELEKERKAHTDGSSVQAEKKIKHAQVLMNSYKDKVTCSLCRCNCKDKVIKKCGHAFCSKCIEDAIKTRQRKCPSCHTQFGHGDIFKLYLQ